MYCARCAVRCDGADGRAVCPTDRHAPLTMDGIAAWRLATEAVSALKIGPAGPAGLDRAMLLQRAEAEGFEGRIMDRLLVAIEAGMMAGLARRREIEKDG